MSNIMPPTSLSYLGEVSVPWIRRTFPPNTTNIEFDVPTMWIDTAGQDAYVLVSKALGIATWVPIGGVPGQLQSLTGNSGGSVFPDTSSNINLLGDVTNIAVVGNPGTNTLTVELVTPVIVASGGTGSTNLLAHSLLLGQGTAAVTALGAATNGQLPIGSTGANPVLGNLTSTGGTLTITNGPGSINLETNNAGTFWTVVTTNQTLSDNNGYFANAAGVLDFALPTTSLVGDTYEVVAMSAGGWQITQGIGQQIRLGNATTTSGVGGSLASTAQGDWIQLVCTVANTNWIANVKQGTITVI